ncbi:uncharacterized protein LOC129457162 [Periophthalmus magnuspinnatus]|uniref:uncharacterized protein LOC129457162 n=1 Tax=Periophthalmus magnuspinnatus TaxID=409849 RepID=UPI0024372BD3|nr:uncharacterized protein LOC129457162 [Periophthalmus magnuspinnatus]
MTFTEVIKSTMAFNEKTAVRQFTIKEDGEEFVVLQINVGVDETPAVNDWCRLCSKYLRINGVLSHTVLLFERSKLQQKSMSDRLADLGLNLKPSKNKSTRMCRSCSQIVTRLENDLAAFRKWKEEEEKRDTDETASTDSPESSDKRARSPSPPATPKPLPKKLRTIPLACQNTRKSITQVITTYANSRSEVKVPSESEAGIIQNIANQNWRTAVNLLSTHKELFDEVKLKILVGVNDESQRLSNPYNQSMLYKTTPDDLRSFSMDKLISELEHRSSLLWSIFQTITKNNNDEAACTALCIALRGREPRVSALAYHINSIIARGGMKRAVFKKLSQMGITTSHGLALTKLKEMTRTKKRAAYGETVSEIDVPAEPLQNPDEELDNSADPEELRTTDTDLGSHLDSPTEQELSTCSENIT